MTIREQLDALIVKWGTEATLHEIAARELEPEEGGSEEHTLHLEIARTLRECASALCWPEQALKPARSNINECPCCKQMYKDGETCKASMGGCPMGGDF